MPTISGLVSVAANATSANVLAGSPFEFVAQPSLVKLAAIQAGAANDDITSDFQIGGESLLQAGNIGRGGNSFPRFNDDVLVEAGAQAGERLFLTFSNTTAGALVVDFLLDVMPI